MTELREKIAAELLAWMRGGTSLDAGAKRILAIPEIAEALSDARVLRMRNKLDRIG